MLVVSDRGDRLLLLNYHGLHAARRCVLPWAEPSHGLMIVRPGMLSDGHTSARLLLACAGHERLPQADGTRLAPGPVPDAVERALFLSAVNTGILNNPYII